MVTFHRQGAWTRTSGCANSTRALWEAGSELGQKTDTPPLANPSQEAPRPAALVHPPPPPPVSLVLFLAPFPGRSPSLGSYLIVDRPVPGFGRELIVLGFEATVPLHEGSKES